MASEKTDSNANQARQIFSLGRMLVWFYRLPFGPVSFVLGLFSLLWGSRLFILASLVDVARVEDAGVLLLSAEARVFGLLGLLICLLGLLQMLFIYLEARVGLYWIQVCLLFWWAWLAVNSLRSGGTSLHSFTYLYVVLLYTWLVWRVK